MTRPIPLFTLLLLLAIPLSLLAGRVSLDPWTTPNATIILAELRLPRAFLAVIVGAGLGTAGAAMQGYLRNPLADPGLFGIAPGAALGAVARDRKSTRLNSSHLVISYAVFCLKKKIKKKKLINM